jgi:hypothetical protein
VRAFEAMVRRVQVGGLGALAVALAALTATSPVLAADDCEPLAAAFGPGDWVARGIQIFKVDEDDRSTAIVEGEGGFRLSISPTGDASGSFSLAGTGLVKSFVEGDKSGLEVQWMTTGKLSGNGTVVRADGTRELAISGQIDSNPNGDGDEWSGTGQELWSFGNETSTDYHGSFSPSAANCNTVFGSLTGPVAFGSATDGDSYFVAVRVGSVPSDVDIEGQLVELLDRAQEVLAMDPLDADILGRFVDDLVAFDALLVSLEYCDVLQANVGPIWAMLRSTLIHAAIEYLEAALGGAYATYDVISVMTAISQGGTLGWRGPDCLEPSYRDDTDRIATLFEDVMLNRLELAWEIPDPNERTAEISRIAAAAYQFGLGRVIAALEGNPS